MKSKKKKPKDTRHAPRIGRKNVDQWARLARHPAVNQLAGIFAHAHRLAHAIRLFRENHRPACRCLCCRYVREHAPNCPGVIDHLSAIEVAIWSSSAVDEDRPMGRADLRRAARFSKKFKKEHGIK